MSDGQPPEKPTVEFEKVPAWAIALKESVDGGFRELKGDISLVANDVTLVKERVTIVENRVGLVEARQDSNSMRAKEMSGVDLRHDAAIASIVTDVSDIKSKLETNTELTTEIKTAVVGFWKRNPKLEVALVGLILLVIGSATTFLTAWIKAHQ